MKLPWTSRERLDEKQRELDELKREVRELREENRKLMNQIVWRSTTVALEPDLLPEHYRPKSASEVQAPANPYADPAKPPAMGSAAMRARSRIREVERESEVAFRARQGYTGPAPVQTTDERQQQAEVVSALNQSADEGVSEAQKKSA